jgi:hypothetical protein
LLGGKSLWMKSIQAEETSQQLHASGIVPSGLAAEDRLARLSRKIIRHLQPSESLSLR